MQQDLLSELRKEQRSSLNPDRYVFRITRQQERDIIKQVTDTAVGEMIGRTSQDWHIATLFGSPVELLD